MSDELPGADEYKPGAGFDELARRAGAAPRHPAPDDGELAITQRHRRQQSLKATVVAGVAVAALIGTAAVVANRNDSDSLAPVDSPPATLPTTTIPRSSWPTFTATRYPATHVTPDGNFAESGLTLGHPPDWTEVPSSRDWNWESDIQDPRSAAHETFISPDGAIRLSAWYAPFDSNQPIQAGSPDVSRDDLVAWVEDYCEQSDNSPCDGIANRAVDLCLEKWDCHPGLLVRFDNDVQAFFTGGLYSGEAMTIVAVWQNESAPAVAPYGGAQQLLESVLATMQVWPASTPRAQRI